MGRALDTKVPQVADEPRGSWRRAVTIGLITYVISRLAVIAGAAVRAAQRVVESNVEGEPRPGSGFELLAEVLTSWDGLWYLMIARDGYPRSIPGNVTYFDVEARIAFFPLFPALVRIVDTILPGGDTLAALLLNAALGAVAVVLVGILARRISNVQTAMYSMMLFAVFPGSFVLSFAYAEALFIVLAAACFISLNDHRWLLAGLWGALAASTRPIGVAVIAACVVAALLVIRTERHWRPLVAVALAPLCLIGFHVYLARHTGEAFVWFRVQSQAWDEGMSFGWTAIQHIWGTLSSPLSSPTELITTVSVITVAALAWYAWHYRLPAPLVVYSVIVIALMLFPETVTARPRFVLGAFPLVIPVAALLPRQSRIAWELVLISSGAGLAALTALYGVYGAIP
jgi:hypothetical protein